MKKVKDVTKELVETLKQIEKDEKSEKKDINRNKVWL